MIRALAVLALAGLGVLPAEAQQDNRCRFRIDRTGRRGVLVTEGRDTSYFAGGGVQFSCVGTAVTMASDSVAAYRGGEVTHFLRNVRYRDSIIAMDADNGTYFKLGERWEARGNVVTRNLRTGSELVGPAMDYLRAVPPLRGEAEVFATGRPTITYHPVTGVTEEPFTIVADRVRLRGDDRVWTGGTSEVRRSDFEADADSIRLDAGTGSDGTLVGGQPVVRGLGQDPFTLHGVRIDLRLRARRLDAVTALDSARAVTGDVVLVADTIALDIERDTLVQTLAWGSDWRPVAESVDYTIVADSLAIDSPGQRLEEIRAFGRANVTSRPDSATGEANWLEGDSVEARFAMADSGAARRLTEVLARGNARSYYQIPNPDRPECPSIDYARGHEITVRFGTDGQVTRVDVVGEADGVHLEATACGAQADPAAPPPDAGTPPPGEGASG